MITYASSHSKTEKKYFDQFGYPGNNQHKKEHASFTKEIADFKINFDTGKIRLSIEIMDFLSNWLQKHIKGIDEKYVPFFTNIGLNHKGKNLVSLGSGLNPKGAFMHFSGPRFLSPSFYSYHEA